jgi:putative ABC transport system ATP-binding protein
MSGGEKQRAFTAICLSLMPKVLMLDEPTAALDEVNAENLLSNIKSFCAENDMTLIVVCHNLQLAKNFADNIIFPEKNGDNHD